MSDALTDFNDRANVFGLDAVRSDIDAAKPVNAPDLRAPAASGGGDQWEEPLLFGRIETPDIPADVLPPIFAEYADALSSSLQTPRAMAVGLTLSVLATCLQRKFKVSPFGDEYRESISIWTLVLAFSGERKSAVLARLMKPVVVGEVKLNEAIRSEIIKRAAQRKIAEKRIEKLQADAAKENDGRRRDEIAQEITDLTEQMPDALAPIRLFTGDVTSERFQSMLMENGGCMSVMSDEGAIFMVLAGLYSGGEAYIDVFLQSYSGSNIRVDRGGRSAVINNPASTFGICIQPGIFQDMAPQARRKFSASGLLARFFYFYPSSRVGQRDMGRREPIPTALENSYRAEVFRLLDIKPRIDVEEGEDDEHILTLSEAARVLWVAFAQKIEGDQADGGPLESMRDWCSKLPGGALRVAGLFHVAGRCTAGEEISLATMDKAVALCRLLIPHARAVFDLLGSDPTADDAKLVWRWIERQGRAEFLRSELHRAHHSRFTKLDRLVLALETLKGRNLIAGPYKGTMTGGRPPIFYRVNPLAMKGVIE